MKPRILKLAIFGTLVLVFPIGATGQSENPGTAKRVLNGAAKTGTVVVGTAGKYTWKATKFTAGKVVRPVIVKSAPAAGKFAWKQTSTAVKFSIPAVKNFAVTYLKFRFSP